MRHKTINLRDIKKLKLKNRLNIFLVNQFRVSIGVDLNWQGVLGGGGKNTIELTYIFSLEKKNNNNYHSTTFKIFFTV